LDTEDLYYYRARYYDPTTQRFLSQDPIGFNSGDFNFYRYVGNRPVNFVDPLGLWVPQVIGAIIGGGFEVYNNGWSWDVAGAVGGFGSNIRKAVADGALGSGLYNAYKQGTNPCKAFDWEEFAKSTALGAAGGGVGGAVGKAGKSIKDYSRATPTITNIYYPSINWSGPIGNYGNSGAAAGAVAGSIISNTGEDLW